MYMQRENRAMLAQAFATIIVVVTSTAFGYLLYRHFYALNINIILSVVGGLILLTGGVLFMVWPESYLPVMLLLAGLGEQAAMFLIYIDIKLKYTGMILLGLLVLVLFCFLGLKELKLHLSDKDLQELEPPRKSALEKRKPPIAG